MADILDDFICQVAKAQEDQTAALSSELVKVRRYFRWTAWLAAASLLAVVVMAVTR